MFNFNQFRLHILSQNSETLNLPFSSNFSKYVTKDSNRISLPQNTPQHQLSLWMTLVNSQTAISPNDIHLYKFLKHFRSSIYSDGDPFAAWSIRYRAWPVIGHPNKENNGVSQWIVGFCPRHGRVPDRIWMSLVGGLLIGEARHAPPCPALLGYIVHQLALGITDLLPHEQHSQGEGCLQREHSNSGESLPRFQRFFFLARTGTSLDTTLQMSDFRRLRLFVSKGSRRSAIAEESFRVLRISERKSGWGNRFGKKVAKEHGVMKISGKLK